MPIFSVTAHDENGGVDTFTVDVREIVHCGAWPAGAAEPCRHVVLGSGATPCEAHPDPNNPLWAPLSQEDLARRRYVDALCARPAIRTEPNLGEEGVLGEGIHEYPGLTEGFRDEHWGYRTLKGVERRVLVDFRKHGYYPVEVGLVLFQGQPVILYRASGKHGDEVDRWILDPGAYRRLLAWVVNALPDKARILNTGEPLPDMDKLLEVPDA